MALAARRGSGLSTAAAGGGEQEGREGHRDEGSDFGMAGPYGTGDQAGWESKVGSSVRLVGPDPSAFIM